jgi:D(-)-tartrate dehydratase
MKIVSAHEDVIAISSTMSNAFIDFSSMDCSILALVSDVVVDGEPLVGYGSTRMVVTAPATSCGAASCPD